MKPVKLAVLCSILALAGCGDKDSADTAKNDQSPAPEQSRQAAGNVADNAGKTTGAAPAAGSNPDTVIIKDKAAESAAAVAPAAGGATSASPDLTVGQNVYEGKCKACHGTGAAGSPKLDDKANWAPRIAQGTDTLVKHALEGFKGKVGYMPPKGGFATLTDDEVKAAVAYMVSQAQ